MTRLVHRNRIGPVLVAGLVLVLAACGTGGPATAPSPAATTPPTPAPSAPSPGPTAVVVDTDMSSDDTMALPFLLREPSLDVLAVTVIGTGLVHCGAGLQAVTNILATLGIDDVPVSCGRSEPLAGTHAFPAEWRAAADDGFGLTLERRPVTMSGEGAPELIRSVAGSAAGPITIIALGPLTNVAEALQGNATLAPRIERIVAMGGAVDVEGNVALGADFAEVGVAEWNMYADPAAADIVFRSGVPITLVPLDATNAVPVTPAFFEALGTDHAAAPADIAYELLARRGVQDGDYFWDQLASVIAVDESVATFETIPLRVITTEGPDSGRTARVDDGVAVRVATAADQAAFETHFLAGLRLGPPRPHPFVLTGTMGVRFDGTTCADERPVTIAAGDWKLDLETTVSGTTIFVVVRFHEGAGWQDLLDYALTEKDPTVQPAFLDAPFGAILEAAGTTGIIAALTPGNYGIVCLRPAESPARGVPGSGEFEVVP